MLIDVNGNGEIDRQEWELSTATDQSDLSQYRLMVKQDFSDKDEILEIFRTKLKEKNISARDFFKFTDKKNEGKKIKF